MGGSLTALAPDFNRAVLGVPGMNYSTLLRAQRRLRPVRASVLYQNYPNELERPLILSLIQILWDRGEANGYAHHMTTTRCRTRRRTRCCCTRRSATTRSRTSRPRSRRARSAPRCTRPRWIRAAMRTSTPYYGIRRFGTYPVRRLGAGRVGQRLADAADGEHAAADGRRPAQPSAQHGDRTAQKSEFLKLGGRSWTPAAPSPATRTATRATGSSGPGPIADWGLGWSRGERAAADKGRDGSRRRSRVPPGRRRHEADPAHLEPEPMARHAAVDDPERGRRDGAPAGRLCGGGDLDPGPERHLHPGPETRADARGHRPDPVPQLAGAGAARFRLHRGLHRPQLAALLGEASAAESRG